MKTKVALLTMTAACSLLTFNHAVYAQGTAFTYQGRLNSGTNAANGTFDVEFTLYSVNSGGSAVAGPVVKTGIGVTNGLFTTTVDFGNVLNGANDWLELAVRTNGASSFSPALTPRQQLTPTPYAVYAETANATNLVGTVPAANLSGVALLAGGNSFTGVQTITGGNTSSGQPALTLSGPGGAEISYGSTTGGTTWDVYAANNGYAISRHGVDFPFLINSTNGNSTFNHSVGIGTASPSKLLDVTGTTSSVAAGSSIDSSLLVRLNNTSTDGNTSSVDFAGIGFGQNSTRQAIVGGTFGNDYLDFYTGGLLTTPKMRVDFSGALTLNDPRVGGTGTGAQITLNDYYSGTAEGALIDTIGYGGGFSWRNGALELRPVSRLNVYKGFDVTSDSQVALTVVGSSGYVGIGTVNPAAQLEVDGNGIFSGLTVGSTNNGITSFSVIGSSGNGQLDIGIAAFDTAYSTSATINDAVIRQSGKGNLYLQTGTGAAAIDISTNNKVGIGTITPQVMLDVYNPIYAQVAAQFAVANCGAPCAQTDYQEGIRLWNQNGNGQVGIGFTVGGGSFSSNAVPGIWLGTSYANHANDFKIATLRGTNLIDRFYISGTNANVGIGTSTPNSDAALQINGKVRMGSETGTSEAPNRSILVRRINGTSSATGQVLARSVSNNGNVMTLERDGTSGGLVLKISGTVSSGSPQISGYGINASGAFVGVHSLFYTGGSYPSTQIFTDAQKIGYLRLSFGEPLNNSDLTTVELTRYVDNSGNNSVNWIGTVTSTINQ